MTADQSGEWDAGEYCQSNNTSKVPHPLGKTTSANITNKLCQMYSKHCKKSANYSAGQVISVVLISYNIKKPFSPVQCIKISHG